MEWIPEILEARGARVRSVEGRNYRFRRSADEEADRAARVALSLLHINDCNLTPVLFCEFT